MEITFNGIKENIDFMKPHEWYWAKNRGVWRGPMLWINPEFLEEPEMGFWFPEWTNEFERINFSINHIDSKSFRSGVIHIPYPSIGSDWYDGEDL